MSLLRFIWHRYAEGTGSAARFKFITDIDFLSSQELVSVDSNNCCLRIVNFAKTQPETSTFAGTCTGYGGSDGHRLNSALFRDARQVEVNSMNSTLFVTDLQTPDLRIVDLKTDEVATLAINYGASVYFMELLSGLALYFSGGNKVISVSPNFDVSTVAGGSSAGDTTGSFELTKFNDVKDLYLWPDDREKVLLVADKGNKRFDCFFLDC